jgi:hypothetical protein
MVPLLAAALVVTAMVALAIRLGLLRRPRQLQEVAQRALVHLRDPELDDDAKGAAMRRHSTELFGLFLLITGTLAAAVAAPVAVLWLLDRLRLVSFADVVAAASSIPFLIASTVVGCAAWALLRRRPRA